MGIEHIRHISNEAINYLIHKTSSQGHWEDIRSTSIAVFAFEEVFQKDAISSESKLGLTEILKDSKAWLFGQARREERGISWNSEVWDTAFSVLALTNDDRFKEKVDLAILWLKSQRSNLSNSWYEEIWETTLATIAIIRYEKSLQGRKFKDMDWLNSTVAWICHFNSENSGMFLTPHYSGFLIWLFVELNKANLTSFTSYQLLLEKATKAVDWVIEISNEKKELWSEYVYANSYVLYAITQFEQIQRKPLNLDLHVIEEWYAKNQDNNGCFEDYEDTSLAILSLYSLVEASEYKKRPIYTISPDKSQIKNIVCFIGYSSKSATVAIQIKEHIRHDFPHILLKDWEWDFEIGNYLFGEIDKMSKISQLAIFLVTKDDILISDDFSNQPAPRDNVIFEVGFFAARLGFNHTILIIEKNTKIPTDLGGILYIPYEGVNNISKVILQLSRHLAKVATE